MIVMQLYAFLQSAVPPTRLISYNQFVETGQKKRIQDYIVHLLGASSEPLTTRDISIISGLEIGSLTSPLLSLTNGNKIIRVGEKKNPKSRRLAITYSISKL